MRKWRERVKDAGTCVAMERDMVHLGTGSKSLVVRKIFWLDIEFSERNTDRCFILSLTENNSMI